MTSLPQDIFVSNTSFQEKAASQKAVGFSLLQNRSLTTRLLAYVLGGAFVGLGGASLLFYQVLQRRAEQGIQGALATQVERINGQIHETEHGVNNLIAAVVSMRNGGIQDAEIYRDLAFQFFLNRPEITIGIGFGQARRAILRDRDWYWPYFYVDQGAALEDAVGVLMDPPYENVRDGELEQYDDYSTKEYWLDYGSAQETVWPEPYPWAGIALQSLYVPIFADPSEQVWLGVAATDINVAVFSESLAEVKPFGDEGYFAILSAEGNLIAFPPDPSQAVALQSYQENPDLRQIWDRIQAQEPLFIEGGNYWATQVLPETGWTVLASVPQGVVLRPVLVITTTAALGAGILLFGVVLLFVRYLNGRLQPIVEKCQMMAASSGQEETASVLQGSDELEVLAFTFDQMSSRLQGSFQALEAANQELEKKVDQRTAALKQSEQRLRRQNEVLATLARNEALMQGQIQQAAIVFTEAVSKTLMVERVSIWLLNATGTTATCLNLYQHRQRRHDSGSEWQRAAYPNYFMALEQRRIIAAENALQDPSTIEFAANYLTPLGIGASLEATIVVAGQVRGMIRCEHVGKPRRWSADEQSFITSVANLIALALEASERVKAQEELAVSEQQQRQAKEALQQRAMELLMEVDPVSEGDLRIRARVTPDEIGTIADSYNSIISNLRDIVMQVQEATRQVNQTASGSEQAVRLLSADATAQAESLTQALDQIQVMVDSSQSVVRRAQEAQAQVQQANQVVKDGDTAMNRTVNGILGIRETVAETTKKVKRLGETSQKISRVVSLINNFAAQTNLLSLNASIEASRAGEQGKGFAVVAEEVRSLAQQSSTATSEIEQLVDAIQRETNEVVSAMESGTDQVVTGTELVEEARQKLSQIATATAQISGLVQEIAAAAATQSQTSTTVGQTIEKVTTIAKQTSAQSIKVAQSFEQLLKVAQELQVSVAQFKIGSDPAPDPSSNGSEARPARIPALRG